MSVPSVPSVPSALNFIKEYREHKEFTKKALDKLNDTYLHERVYITLSSPETCKRAKTVGVITNINDTLGKHFRFTIVTEDGRELVIRYEPRSTKAIVQGAIVDVNLEVC